MRRLMTAFPYPVLDPKTAKARSDLYREHLGHLQPDVWLRAVSDAISDETERTFPPVAVIASYARHVSSSRILPPARRTPDEIAEGKAEAKKALEKIKALALDKFTS